MNSTLALFRPRLLSFRNNRLSTKAREHRVRFYLLSLMGILFWFAVFVVFYRVLTYFQGVEGFGDILAHRLLYLAVMTFFTLLIFSGVITALSKLYLSRDLMLVHSLPVPSHSLFLVRWTESLFDSSWMVVLYSMPVFLSYGVVYGAGPLFYIVALIGMGALCVIASGISALMVMAGAIALPAGRIRTVFVVLGVGVVLLLVMAIRLMRPEQLVNPDSFANVALYLQSLATSGSPLLPTTWVYEAIQGALGGRSVSPVTLDVGLAASGALSLIFLNVWMARWLYFPGFSKAQTTPERLFPVARADRSWTRLFNRFKPHIRAFVIKEIRTFFRDQTQWPQLFLIGALIVVYLYNFSVLPLERSPIQTVYLQNLFSFLNMALAAFVLTAVAARFVFPAVSLEGDAFWIVRSSPVSLRLFLWVKFFVYFLPLLVMTEILILASNLLLQVTPFMMVLSMVTMLCVTPGVVAMGIGLGAAYGDFHAENPAESVTSFGGLLYMILCVGFILLVVALEAGPVYTLFMAVIRGQGLTILQWIWLVVSFSLAGLLCLLTVVISMRFGERRLGLT